MSTPLRSRVADALIEVRGSQAGGLRGPQPWARESDMLPGVLAHRNLLAPGAMWRAFHEVPGPQGGIIDLVWVRFSKAALGSRPKGTAALDMTSIRTLLAVSAGVPTASLLATCVGVSRSHLAYTVLPRLRDAGWVDRIDRTWMPARPYRPVATAAVTVELKRDDWRGALQQAARHRASSDASWVVLDAQRTGAASSAAASFTHAGVGLASLALSYNGRSSADTDLRVVHPSGRNNSVDVAGRSFLGEQCLALHRLGVHSGPNRQVFGRFL